MKPTCLAALSFVMIFAHLHAQQVSSVSFTSSNLPIVVINTYGKTIPDEPKIPAAMGIVYNGEGVRNMLTDPFNNYNGRIDIEVRGSSSQQFEKKQYGFTTVDSADADLDVSLLGFPTEHTWILSAQYNDKSLLRDAFTFLNSREMGRYATRLKYCELVLNGDYRGVYILMEKIKRDKNRVNISKTTAADTTGDALTGGYIIKTDKADHSTDDGWEATYAPFASSTRKYMYQYDYPDPGEIVPVQKSYIHAFVKTFETVMNSQTYADTATGYPSIIDVDSFVDMVIMNEFSKNVDGYRLSTFFYKDRTSKNKKMFAGPLWDYNLGYGNCNYYSAYLASGWQLDALTLDPDFLRSDPFQTPFWWRRLWTDGVFKKKVAIRWTQLRTGMLSIARVTTRIDSLAGVIAEARARNFERWPIFGTYVWPNYYISTSYEDEILYIKGWIVRRFNWMDNELAAYVTNVHERSSTMPLASGLVQNYPNPFNPSTVITYSITTPQHVALTITDVLGRNVQTLVNGTVQTGMHEAVWDASAMPGGVYFCRLQAGTTISTIRMLVIK
jgi:hypothetical protein